MSKRACGWRSLASGVVASLLLATAAHADAIDGNWCNDTGRYLSIRGPEIVTPYGTKMQGNYARHHFSYVVPASEPDAGQNVAMTLVNEMTVHLVLGARSNSPSVWRRCAPPAS